MSLLNGSDGSNDSRQAHCSFASAEKISPAHQPAQERKSTSNSPLQNSIETPPSEPLHGEDTQLVTETPFYKRNQTIRAEEIVKGGAKHIHVRDV